jgi:uncharacterized protein
MDREIENIIDEVKAFANDFYNNQGQTHGREHLERTLALSKYLADKEDADEVIIRLGAILHQLHDVNEAKKVIEGKDLDEDTVEKVLECVKYSDIEKINESASLEAKVVYDADKLQVVGPFGLIREIACETGERGNSFREGLENSMSIEEKCFESLQTDTGQQLGEKHHRIMEEFWEKFDEMDEAAFEASQNGR